MVGTVTQQPPEVTKPQANKVQATEAEEESEAFVEEEAITYSANQNTRHKLLTSRDKQMVLERYHGPRTSR